MPIVEFKNIFKSYGDCHACQGISFAVQAGSIHALIGENGAGKSTLMKIFGGLETASSGDMLLHGKPYKPATAKEAFQHKIGFVHQHFLLAENRTVLEHFVLNWPTNSLLAPVDNKALLEKVNSYLKKFGWKLNLHARISELSVGEQQRIEIIKALLNDPEIIIFDEPTAVLAPQEIDQFLGFLKQLQAEKKTILLISHKLKEIKNVSDTLTILRSGKSILTTKTSELSTDDMAQEMIGRKLNQPKLVNRSGVQGKSLFKIGTLEIKTFDILGFAGIEGNGQSDLIIELLNLAKKNNLSVADIAEDRLKFAVFSGSNLMDHMVLRHPKKFSRYRFIDTEKVKSATEKMVATWDVRPRNSQIEIGSLSGGNQQKFVVGRELYHNPDFIMAAHPTRGVDLGAQETIHSALINAATIGKSVALVSADLEEILKLSDRYCILFENNLHGPFMRGQLTESEIGLYMTGSHPQQAQALLKDLT